MVATITRAQLWGEIERGEPLTILEVLPEPYFRKAHLPGAQHLPPDNLGDVSRVVRDRDARIVVYCADLECPNSAFAARQLSELGYTDVRDYAEGKRDWMLAGLPVETSGHRMAGQRITLSAADVDAVLPVSCSLEREALSARSDELRGGLFTSVEETLELPDGYAYRFPGDDAVKARLFEFVNVERTCCAFFRIELAFEAGLGPIWLRLTGPAGTKAFIEQTFMPGRREVAHAGGE